MTQANPCHTSVSLKRVCFLSSLNYKCTEARLSLLQINNITSSEIFLYLRVHQFAKAAALMIMQDWEKKSTNFDQKIQHPNERRQKNVLVLMPNLKMYFFVVNAFEKERPRTLLDTYHYTAQQDNVKASAWFD